MADGGSGDGSESVDFKARSLILTKVYALIIVFFATFFSGISPYFFRWNETFLMLGTQFASGVFLAAAMIHFLGDSHNTFLSLLSNAGYSYGEILAVVSYLLTMLADVAIQRVHSRGLYQPDSKVTVDVESSLNVLENKATVATANLGDALLLILELCFHSIFEGIAISVSPMSTNTWGALWTISLHKLFAAVAMGVALLRMLPNRRLLQCCMYAFCFAISTPMGVAIGIIIDSSMEGNTADWFYAIAMGIATGVFVYVAINHLLAKRYRLVNKVALDRPFWRWLAVATGATVFAVAMIWD